jgi:diaminopimelate epimerase
MIGATLVAGFMFLIPTFSSAYVKERGFDCTNSCKFDGTGCASATMGCWCGADC